MEEIFAFIIGFGIASVIFCAHIGYGLRPAIKLESYIAVASGEVTCELIELENKTTEWRCD